MKTIDIQYDWKFGLGIDGEDYDSHNPIARAFEVLIRDGRPHVAHSYCFYCGEQTDPHVSSQFRWLGVLVLTEGNRIIFFPGLDTPPNWVQGTKNGVVANRHYIDLDHFSLEPDRQRWHFTSPRSVNHKSAGRSPHIGNGNLLWFGMSIRSDAELRLARKQTGVRLCIPASDIQRRTAKLSCLHSRSRPYFISLLPSAKMRFHEGFPHFTFVAGPSGSPDFIPSGKSKQLLTPFGSPDYSGSAPRAIKALQIARRRINLGDKYDVQVIVTWLPGKIAHPAVVTTRKNLWPYQEMK